MPHCKVYRGALLAAAITLGLVAHLAGNAARAQDFQAPAARPYQAPIYGAPAANPQDAAQQMLAYQAATIRSASAVLAEITSIPERGIPASLLSEAHAVAVVPGVIKVGFIAGVRRGHGVILARDAGGTWSVPQFVTLTGGSIGFQAGAQSTDVVLVFKNPETVDAMMRGKITLGADAAVAAGPVGRRAEVGTDLQLKAEIFSYSRSRGLFAGVSLDGASLKADAATTAAFYAGGTPEEAVQLVQMVATLSQTEAANPAAVPTPVQMTARPESQPTPAAAAMPGRGAVPAAQQLATSWRALDGKLDDAWRKYLALPPQVFAGQPPSVEALGRSLQAYETVAGNPQFAAVAQMPEFQATLQSLRSLIVERATAPALQPLRSPTMLPAPPR